MIPRRRNGLGALIPGEEFAAVAAPETVPLTAIAVNPYQPRRLVQPEALDELTESIRQHGILQPLTVRSREGGYELIAGGAASASGTSRRIDRGAGDRARVHRCGNAVAGAGRKFAARRFERDGSRALL